MSGHYANARDPLADISTLPEVLDTLRRSLTSIERSSDTLHVHLASARAKRGREALEVLKMLKPAEIERLYLLFEENAQARVQALLL